VPGVGFKDITPLLADPQAFAGCVEALAALAEGTQVDLVAAAEARGFVFGVSVAQKLGVGFVPIRKPGKLPDKVISLSYELEYGTDTLEVHADAIAPGQRVLLVDDVLATGGTARATCDLVERAGGEVAGCVFLMELEFLGGRGRLEEFKADSLVRYTAAD